MNKRAFLFLTLLVIGFTSCELPDIGVAYDPTNGNRPVVDLNEIDGSWNFSKIEVVTDNNELYSIEGVELVNTFADLGLKSTANVQRFLRNKMEFDAESVTAYVINQVTPFQGPWKYTPEKEKLVLFANSQDSETYTIKGLSPDAFTISTAKVILSEIPTEVTQQSFEQVIAQQIGKKIVELKQPEASMAADVASIQVIIRYQR